MHGRSRRCDGAGNECLVYPWTKYGKCLSCQCQHGVCMEALYKMFHSFLVEFTVLSVRLLHVLRVVRGVVVKLKRGVDFSQSVKVCKF